MQCNRDSEVKSVKSLSLNAIHMRYPHKSKSCRYSCKSTSTFENCVQTLSQTVASHSAKSTNIEEIVCSLASRVPILETNAMSVSSGAARQDPGTFLDMATAPQPLDLSAPLAKGRLMTVEIRGVDLILLRALMTNKREVPYYFDSLVSNITKELRYGSMILEKNLYARVQQTCQNSLQSRFRVSEARIRNKSQVSGLCGPMLR